ERKEEGREPSRLLTRCLISSSSFGITSQPQLNTAAEFGRYERKKILCSETWQPLGMAKGTVARSRARTFNSIRHGVKTPTSSPILRAILSIHCCSKLVAAKLDLNARTTNPRF